GCAALVQLLADVGPRLGPASFLLAFAVERHASMLGGLDRSGWSITLYDAILPIFREHASVQLLSMCQIHRGVVLLNLHHFADAVASFDQATGTLRRLVEVEGRAELADDLATAMTNKGVALGGEGRLVEAVATYDEAICIRR